MDNDDKWRKLKLKLVIIFAVVLAILTFAGGNDYDPAHDPNGFLGYSDDFWEWVWYN